MIAGVHRESIARDLRSVTVLVLGALKCVGSVPRQRTTIDKIAPQGQND